MKRNISSFLAIGAFYTAVSACLLVPTQVAAQSPPQGPPTASSNAHSVLSNNLTGVLGDTIQPAIDAENAKLATDPNFRAVITATPIVSFPYMGQTTNLYQPNQFFADVPYSLLYTVTNISVHVNGSWVPYAPSAVIGQDVNLQATCQGWFTGQGTLTYAVIPSPAWYRWEHEFFANPEVGTLLQQVIPSFVNTTVKAKFRVMGQARKERSWTAALLAAVWERPSLSCSSKIRRRPPARRRIPVRLTSFSILPCLYPR